MFTFVNSTERIFSLAQLLISSSSSSESSTSRTQPRPPPAEPSSVEALLQTVTFPDHESDDGSSEENDVETDPIDLSLPWQSRGGTSHSMMDPFRSALFSPEESFSYPTPDLPGEVLAIASDDETRLMSVFSLLRLLPSLSTEQGVKDTQAIEVSSRDDPIVDSLLEEESRAQDDEYIEESYFISAQSQYQTRSSTQAGGGAAASENDDSISIQDEVITTTTPTTTTTSSSSSSSSSSASTSQTDESLDQALFLSDNDQELQSVPPISHPPFCGDDAEYQLAYHMDQSLSLMSASLPGAFVYFMNHLLPRTDPDVPEKVLSRLTWFFSYSFHSGSLLPNLDGELQRLDKGISEDRIASQIIKVLLFSSISESSCERMFSRARFIVGKRRYQLNRRALFSSLLISDHSVKNFLAEEQHEDQ